MIHILRESELVVLLIEGLEKNKNSELKLQWKTNFVSISLDGGLMKIEDWKNDSTHYYKKKKEELSFDDEEEDRKKEDETPIFET
jgi:hypothetical protein